MKRLFPIVVIASVLAVAGYLIWTRQWAAGTTVISGVIEADDIHVGSKVGGRVLKVIARKGQNVKAGDVLVQFDARDQEAALNEAKAALAQAEAKYLLMTTGFRSEEVAQGEAAERQAKAEFDRQVAGPRRQEIDQTKADWLAAKAQAENARRLVTRLADLAQRELIAKQELDDAVAKADEAEQKTHAARERYDLLLAGTRKEEIERARQAWQEAQARVRMLRTGFREEEVLQTKAELDAARARVEFARSQLDETVIKSPVDALVDELDLEPGDLVAQGRPVATLLRTAELWVRAYLPEDRLGKARPGMKVRVRVDSYPRRDFAGVIRRVRRQAEFTPRNVQTHEERVLQVFETEVALQDPEQLLRPGMSADVSLTGQ